MSQFHLKKVVVYLRRSGPIDATATECLTALSKRIKGSFGLVDVSQAHDAGFGAKMEAWHGFAGMPCQDLS